MTVKNTKRTRRKYDATFKEEVLKMVALGRPVPEIAQALGIGDNLVYRWKNTSQAGKTKENDQNSESAKQTDTQTEIERLKSELRRTEQERDILKKALGIFSRGI
jgi:transposase